MNGSALRARFFQSTIDALHIGVLVIDAKGVIVFANSKAKRILGAEGRDLHSMKLMDFAPDAWPDFKKILNTGIPQLNVKAMKGGNQEIIAHRNPIFDAEKVVGVVSIFQNTSELEKISKELSSYKQLADELDTIIESSYDGISVTDGSGTVLRVNSAWEKITGLSASEVVGRYMGDLEKEGYVSEAIPILVLRHRCVITKPSRLLGSGRDVLVTSTPIFDDRGNINLVVTNVRDMTDLNSLNEQLEKSRKQAREYCSKLRRLRMDLNKPDELVAVSKQMRDVLDLALRVSRVEAPVLLQGETGVGKEVVARLIHSKGPRSNNGRFIKIDCGAIPENLLESELFGYEKGAFTGASDQGKKGRIELAEGGTLFLDEIEALSLPLQAKLLSAVQDLEIMPVGGTNPKKINSRIITASNKDLRHMVQNKVFREDLFFRLNVVPIYIPPLRERKDDIVPLVNSYVQKYNAKYEKTKRFSRQVIDCLMDYEWTGNVRELANLIEQLVIVTHEEEIIPDDLPRYLRKDQRSNLNDFNLHDISCFKEMVQDFETNLIRQAINKYGSARKAAQFLKVDPSTLTRKLKRYDTSGAGS